MRAFSLLERDDLTVDLHELHTLQKVNIFVAFLELVPRSALLVTFHPVKQN